MCADTPSLSFFLLLATAGKVLERRVPPLTYASLLYKTICKPSKTPNVSSLKFHCTYTLRNTIQIVTESAVNTTFHSCKHETMSESSSHKAGDAPAQPPTPTTATQPIPVPSSAATSRLANQPSSGSLKRDVPPSPRSPSRHPSVSLSSSAIADLLSSPPQKPEGVHYPKDWRQVQVKDVIGDQQLKFVYQDTTVESACQASNGKRLGR